MTWIELTNIEQLEEIDQLSKQQAIGIFKHSTRCSISASALDRLKRKWPTDTELVVYFLDLLAFRNISNAIAEKYGVKHQSPQFLLIRNGQVVYSESHYGINVPEILEVIA